MFDEEIEYIVEIWNRCKKKEKVSKKEIIKAMEIFTSCCLADKSFKRQFDAKTSPAFHRKVMIDLEEYLNTM